MSDLNQFLASANNAVDMDVDPQAVHPPPNPHTPSSSKKRDISGLTNKDK